MLLKRICHDFQETKKSFPHLVMVVRPGKQVCADEELISIRVEMAGIPTYYCMSLQNLGEYGDADAACVRPR